MLFMRSHYPIIKQEKQPSFKGWWSIIIINKRSVRKRTIRQESYSRSNAVKNKNNKPRNWKHKSMEAWLITPSIWICFCIKARNRKLADSLFKKIERKDKDRKVFYQVRFMWTSQEISSTMPFDSDSVLLI